MAKFAIIQIARNTGGYGQASVTIYGSSADQLRAYTSIKALGIIEGETSSSNYANPEQPEENKVIDFSNFDWTKANKECVCFVCSHANLMNCYTFYNILILFTGGISETKMGDLASYQERFLQGRSVCC